MPEPAPRGWWSRNWKWVVPVGCLTPILCCGGFIAILLTVIFGALKSSDPYKEAVAKAQAHPQVKKALGEPVTPGWWVMGKIEVSGTSGKAKLVIPISGPKKSARIALDADKELGKWKFNILLVGLDDKSDVINLLDDWDPDKLRNEFKDEMDKLQEKQPWKEKTNGD